MKSAAKVLFSGRAAEETRTREVRAKRGYYFVSPSLALAAASQVNSLAISLGVFCSIQFALFIKQAFLVCCSQFSRLCKLLWRELNGP